MHERMGFRGWFDVFSVPAHSRLCLICGSMKIVLPDVTLVAISAVATELTKAAINDTLKVATPAKTLFYSREPTDWCDDWYGHWIPAAPQSLIEVAEILWRDVPYRVETSHYLTIQWDGWALNPFAWTDEFLDYDYIGAPWWWHPENRVGNGGFSLRSARLGRFVAAHGIRYSEGLQEDEVICRKYRQALEFCGFRWAPELLAQRFSFEHGDPAPGGSFGFHDCRNWPKVLKPAEFEARIGLADSYVREKTEFRQMLENLTEP